MRQAITALAQESWAKQGLLWGSWRCSETKHCGVTYSKVCLDGGKCIRCGSPASYLGVTLVDKTTGLTCQAGSIVFVPKLDGYVVFSLKMRNSNVVSNAENPYLSDIYQTAVAATLLTQIHWLRVVGRALLWIGKSKPKPYKLWTYPGCGEDMVDQQFKLKLDLDIKLKSGRVTEVEGRCIAPQDAGSCPFTGICFSSVRDRLLIEEYDAWRKASHV